MARSSRTIERRTIGTEVRRALGAAGRALSAKALRSAARAFAQAGRAALQRQPESPAESARQVTTARRALAAGRRGLAVSTVPGDGPVIIDPAWRTLKAAKAKHEKRLRDIDGVVGVGLGYRRRRGRPRTRERCVLVFVSRKWTTDYLRDSGRARIPRTLRVGKARVPTDVVQFGTLNRQLQGGDSLGPTQKREMGSLGVVAIDNATGRPIALTAMHVTGRREFPPGLGADMVSPSLLSPGALPLGHLLRGTMQKIDAAAIALDSPDEAVRAIRGIGPVRGWRPVSHPGDQGTLVQMFGARTGRTVFGRITDTFVDLPEFDLKATILVDIPSTSGDSGAAIVDNEGFVLGLLVGASSSMNNLKVFNPISSVLARLACDIPTREDT